MPRVKALTTGSVPSFLDVILNFAESDTSSSLATQDTWLAQARANLHNGTLVFYGDDTWLKLFPNFFSRHDGTSSFFVSDFTEVDNNVTRHVPNELQQPDWDVMVLHYLGLDHIGHKAGPTSPNMLPKQKEMDAIVKLIYQAMELNDHLDDTLLVLAGDHGMNSAGNHGGSAPGETEPALVFISPKLKDLEKPAYTAPTLPKHGTEFEFYHKVAQNDVVPTLSALLGIPISRNNLGIILPEMLGFWKSRTSAKGLNVAAELLYRNALQMLAIIKAKFGDADAWKYDPRTHGSIAMDCENLDDEKRLICRWFLVRDAISRSKQPGELVSTIVHLREVGSLTTRSVHAQSKLIQFLVPRGRSRYAEYHCKQLQPRAVTRWCCYRFHFSHPSHLFQGASLAAHLCRLRLHPDYSFVWNHDVCHQLCRRRAALLVLDHLGLDGVSLRREVCTPFCTGK
jgi:ethanolaminephosphotransferase